MENIVNISKEHLESIESDFESGTYYEKCLIGMGSHAPIYKIVFEVVESYGGQFSYHEERTYYAVDIETWSFDTDADDLYFDDIKDDLYKVDKVKKISFEWVKVKDSE